MIGQKKLLAEIKKQIDNHTLPQFIIITGVKGSGKKLLVDEIRSMIGCMSYKIADTKIDSIRWLIQESYKTKVPAIYRIADADNMSVNAKNALLKVTEEPPNQAYFIMTLEDINNTLPTIRSRATVFEMDSYTKGEIIDYCTWMLEAEINDSQTRQIVTELCDTPGDVGILKKCGAKEFYNYVQKVVDNIAEVSGSNCFKIGNEISFKEDDEKYDLKLFWKAFMKVCMDRVKEDTQKYTSGALLTSNYIKDLRNKSINRQMLFDHWILSIRRIWM